jgi:Cys-tRNA(Pro)/Cys-tRNA(Cys) deacylase
VSKKPLGVRVLEQRDIPHTVVRFPDHIRSAASVADAAGLRLHEVFKTLVVQTERPGDAPMLVLAPADISVDLKLLATQVRAKRLHMASHRDAESLTGLKVGGISALALLQKRWTVLMDDSANELREILVSAGARGFDVRISVSDLAELTGARSVTLIKRPG